MCPIYSSDWCAGIDSLQLMESSPSPAYDDDDLTTLIILAIVNTAPLLGGNAVLFDMKIPPKLCFWVLFQIGTRRRCAPLEPCNLGDM